MATEPSVVVEAFERVEVAFGRDWIEQSRILPLVVPKGIPPQSTVTGGSHPVLTVVKMGALLAALEGVSGADALIGKLRRGERGARAEATAIYLLRQHPSDSILSLSLRSLFPDGQTGRATFAFVGTATAGPMWRSAPPTRPPPSRRRRSFWSG
jgi:hypothetical protein